MDSATLHDMIENLVEIGCALSSERNIDALLSRIVDEARRLTRADGGTLFLIDRTRTRLEWAIVQNASMDIRRGGASDPPLEEDAFQPIALCNPDPVLSNVATYVAHTGEVVNIADCYSETDEFDFEGPRQFDAATGYRTRSMLVVPLEHYEGGMIGVLQLINALDDAGQPVAFDSSYEGLARSLASQAAVALKNAELFEELELQFEAMIRSIATAIDEKSPYTAGHVRRVVDLTMRLSKALNDADHGEYAQVRFDADELKAMRIAAWMHDIGKITTPEWVVDKATKLEGLHDRIDVVEERFLRLEREVEIEYLKSRLDPDSEVSENEAGTQRDRRIKQLQDDLAFVKNANQGKEYMNDSAVERIEGLEKKGLLTREEAYNLSIRKGTLTHEEREIIKNHARVSHKMLDELPFSRHLTDVPEIAASHHEKLNGTGYPRGLKAHQLDIRARILAVADIFEALTAADRPYKKPTPMSGVRKILGFMIKDGELDEDLVNFAIESGVFDDYANDEITSDQRDIRLAAKPPLAK